MRNLQGMALITVLIFLQILTLLGLYAIRMAWLEIKQSHNAWYKHSIRNAADTILNEIENKTINVLPDCTIGPTTTAELLARPLSWWQTQTCTGNFKTFRYYYVVEVLGGDACAIIQINPNKITTNYFRITLLCLADRSKLILQSTLALPNSDETLICDGIQHQVSRGRQMWRELHQN